MGTINQGILGNVSGRVGNVVGSSWKGIGVVKIKPSSVANPQTAAQVEQRTRMSSVVAFAKPLLQSWIKPLWDRFAQKQSGYNAFCSANISLFNTDTPLDVPSLVMSVGNMEGTPIVSAGFHALDGEVEVQWSSDTSGFQLANDTAYVCVIGPGGELLGLSSDALRSDGSVIIPVPSNIESFLPLTAFLSFKRANGLYVSQSSSSVVVAE